MLNNLIEEALSSGLLVIIALIGLGFIVKGKPRRQTDKFRTRSGDTVYIRKDNFTKKLIKIAVVIVILMLLGKVI